MKQLHDRAEAQALALAIVDTLPEPFLVLDDSLHLLAGSRCFYEVFGERPRESSRAIPVRTLRRPMEHPGPVPAAQERGAAMHGCRRV